MNSFSSLHFETETLNILKPLMFADTKGIKDYELEHLRTNNDIN